MKSPREFTRVYAEAVRAADVEGYTQLYDSRVRIFDRWNDWQAKGQNSCREQATEWFGSLGSERVLVTFSDVEITEAKDLAILTAIVRYESHDSDNHVLRFLDERITVGFERTDGGEWKVIHQHTSAPTDGSTMTSKMTLD
ncbi:MAG: DUF4440 domain-containing protein [Proteobacteria bacterium]|nr:MAG: DUF4440 domain-containing protein [Pseudomonadota bacterium]